MISIQSADRFQDFLHSISDEDARILWLYSGQRGPFPGAHVAILRMLQPVTRSGERRMARYFASLQPQVARQAILALLRSVSQPATSMVAPVTVPADLSPRQHWTTTAPTRGSPSHALEVPLQRNPKPPD